MHIKTLGNFGIRSIGNLYTQYVITLLQVVIIF